MKLVVGLGNPGKKYERTRHNAGFWWVQRLARGAQMAWSEDSKFHGLVAQLSAPPEMRLLMPTTFMNHSGQAVAALAGFYKIAPQEILVVHDELDLPAGGVKLKYGGGISGHNGLRDIAAQLDSRDFWRLRIGIGHPRDSVTSEQDVVDYVLHPPRAEEQAAIEDAISRSLEIWPMLAAGDEQGAMLKLHTKNDQSE